MLENENNMENLEGTNDQEVPGAEQDTDGQATDTSQDGAEQDAGESSEGTQNAEDEQFLPIRYNHEDMTLSREEAIEYAQLGKLYQDSGLDVGTLKPIYNKLDYIAAQKGVSIEALVDGIIASDEAVYRQGLVDKFGDDSNEVDLLMKVYRDGQKEKYENILKDRATAAKNAANEQRERLESRLADEFIELQAEFPNIENFADLPKSVKEAAEKGKDLLSCYLRYRHSEDKKIEAARKAAEEASKGSTGSGKSADIEEDGATSEFLKGLWGK